jgi:hypothetical protein
MYTVVEIQRNAYWRDDNGHNQYIVNNRFLTSDDLGACVRMLAVRQIEGEIQNRADVKFAVLYEGDENLSPEDQRILDRCQSDLDSEYLYEDLERMGYTVQEIAAAMGDENYIAEATEIV